MLAEIAYCKKQQMTKPLDLREQLTALIEWCQKATGPDRDLDDAISSVVNTDVRSYTASLDAALPGELIGKMLYSHVTGRFLASHFERTPGGEDDFWIDGTGATEPLARRAAALRARLAKEGEKDE